MNLIEEARQKIEASFAEVENALKELDRLPGRNTNLYQVSDVQKYLDQCKA